MTKNEYIEFTNLQEHFEWLHAAEDKAKTKLETFTTDDSEFDVLVREAIKVYFETEIDKAWKQIEGFKTAPTLVNNREDAIKYAAFEHSVGGRVSIPLDILEKAGRWFRYCFDHGCPDIYERFHRGEYKIEIKEDDK